MCAHNCVHTIVCTNCVHIIIWMLLLLLLLYVVVSLYILLLAGSDHRPWVFLLVFLRNKLLSFKTDEAPKPGRCCTDLFLAPDLRFAPLKTPKSNFCF